MGSQLQSVEQTTMKAFSLLALVAAAYGSDPYAPPAPYAPAPYAPAPTYGHAPVVAHAANAPVVAHAVHAPVVAPVHHAVHAAPAYHAPAPAYHADPYHEEKPKDYQFGYDVHGYDEYGNPNVHSRVEQRDGYNVKGQYRVELPDCRVQIVDYFVDEYKQYHADVKYEGTPCPDKSLLKHHKDGYHAPAPAYAPAPVVHAAPAYHAPVVPAPAYAPAPVVPAPAYAPAPVVPAYHA